jgi:protein-disulfide isomerase
VVENVSVDDDPSWGPEDAPVTIVEFSDFQCPYCARFVTQTYPQIKQQYEGKVRFVFRDFPLTQIHENAQNAAEAAGCANEQGKFWEYHDMLFTNQSALDVASLKSYASQLGLDSATFDQCLDSGKYAEEIQKDLQDGNQYGVQGTPSFFVNGLLVSGAQPFSVFQAVIDAALEGG